MLPPTYLLLGLIGMGLCHVLWSGPRLIEGMWRWLGLFVALAGAWLCIRADALFKALGTEIKPGQPSRQVVREGPYRFSRHPMYLGFMGIVVGVAVLAGTIVPLLFVVLMFAVFSVLFVIPEERHMEQQFGDEYRQYRSRVRRWL